MAHNITDTDGAVFHKQAAWHGLGLVIQEDMSPTQAMELAGLNWEVELTGPVMAHNNHAELVLPNPTGCCRSTRMSASRPH
jgi:hypothetical protein